MIDQHEMISILHRSVFLFPGIINSINSQVAKLQSSSTRSRDLAYKKRSKFPYLNELKAKSQKPKKQNTKHRGLVDHFIAFARTSNLNPHLGVEWEECAAASLKKVNTRNILHLLPTTAPNT